MQGSRRCRLMRPAALHCPARGPQAPEGVAGSKGRQGIVAVTHLQVYHCRLLIATPEVFRAAERWPCADNLLPACRTSGSTCIYATSASAQVLSCKKGPAFYLKQRSNVPTGSFLSV